MRQVRLSEFGQRFGLNDEWLNDKSVVFAQDLLDGWQQRADTNENRVQIGSNLVVVPLARRDLLLLKARAWLDRSREALGEADLEDLQCLNLIETDYENLQADLSQSFQQSGFGLELHSKAERTQFVRKVVDNIKSAMEVKDSRQ